MNESIESNESNLEHRSNRKSNQKLPSVFESNPKITSSPSSSTIYKRHYVISLSNSCLLWLILHQRTDMSYHYRILAFMINTPSTDGEDKTSTGKCSTSRDAVLYLYCSSMDRIDDMYSTTDLVYYAYILILLQQTNQSITLLSSTNLLIYYSNGHGQEG